MRVYEVAKEFDVSADLLIQLFRKMGVSARSEASTVTEVDVSKLRARLERERRAGHEDTEEAIESVLEEKQTTGRRRRRRRTPAAEAEETEEDTTADVAADAAEAMAAEAAEKAAERGAEVVTTGGDESKDTTVVVESPGPVEPSEEELAAAAPAAAGEAEEVAEQTEPAGPEAEVEEPEEEEAVTAEAAEDQAVDIEAEAAEEVAEEVEEAEEPEEDLEAAQAEQEEAPAAEKAAPRKKKKKAKAPPKVSEGMPDIPAPAASAGPGGQVRIQAEGYTSDGRRKRKKGKKRRKQPDKEAVQDNVQRVMAELKSGGGTTKKRRRSRDTAEERQEKEEEAERQAAEEAQTVRVNEYLTVAELSELIDQSSTEIISSAFKNLGLMVTINQRLDFDQIELLLDEFGYRAVREEEYGTEPEATVVEDAPEDLQPRPPVVTVMGHVDHGKTKLLDYIRRANVVAGEAGGITQHIGAYHVTLDDERSLSFLDTPGHAAFTAMRARGAEVTDIVILVVAADDSVMPQTVEAISHAKNAGVPLVIAINKTDLPAADAGRVRQQLLEHEVVVEEFGGDVLDAEVSALKGEGVDDLLDKVLLQAELLELKANPDRPGQATVVESQLDVGKGPVATVLVTNGTLRVGDSFVCGLYDGRIRALLDERGNTVEAAGPGVPVQVLGMPGVPEAGDLLVAMEPDRAAEISNTRQRLDREKQLRIKSTGVKLTDISKMLAEGETSQLNLVIKGDVNGSVQALSDSLEQLSNEEVEVEVIHRGVGAINESDVLLAASAEAVIIGFHVRPDANARAVAERENVDIQVYNIIYEAVEEVSSALEGMLTPGEREVMLGAAEVRQLFKVPRVGTVAGCYVTEGVIDRGARVRVVRGGIEIYDGTLGSLKRFKDDVREVREGFECGLNIEGFNDVKTADVIECYRVEEVARTLAEATAEGA